MIISGHLDGVLRLWDGRTSKCIKELNQIHQGSITSTMISSHGDYLLTLARDHRICVTDTRTFQPVTTIE
jgi:autophagy-related protein 16